MKVIDQIGGRDFSAYNADCVTFAQGLPDNSIDISVALRALADVDMLVGTKDRRPRTYQHDIAGQEQAGVIVRPAHIQGLDPADFQAT